MAILGGWGLGRQQQRHWERRWGTWGAGGGLREVARVRGRSKVVTVRSRGEARGQEQKAMWGWGERKREPREKRA